MVLLSSFSWEITDSRWRLRYTTKHVLSALKIFSVFFALPQSQFLFCFYVSFVLLYNPFHFIFIFCILSVHCTFSPLLLFRTTSCSLSHPPPHSVLFSLSLSLSWFCAHAPCLENSSESHCGKFPARLFLCGNLVSQPRCLKIKSRLYLWHLCSKQQLRIDTKSSDEN